MSLIPVASTLFLYMEHLKGIPVRGEDWVGKGKGWAVQMVVADVGDSTGSKSMPSR